MDQQGGGHLQSYSTFRPNPAPSQAGSPFAPPLPLFWPEYGQPQPELDGSDFIRRGSEPD